MFHLGTDSIMMFMIFAIPIVAIVGGITAGIVRTMARTRLAELAARERIAAIERGIDPSKLPGMAETADLGGRGLAYPGLVHPVRYAQGLMVGGLVTLFVGVALGLFLHFVDDSNSGAWAVGLIPGAVGLALLLGAVIVWPRGERSQPPRA